MVGVVLAYVAPSASVTTSRCSPPRTTSHASPGSACTMTPRRGPAEGQWCGPRRCQDAATKPAPRRQRADPRWRAAGGGTYEHAFNTSLLASVAPAESLPAVLPPDRNL